MALRTTRWDSAEYLKTEEDIAGFLKACAGEAPDDAEFQAHAKRIAECARLLNLSRNGSASESD